MQIAKAPMRFASYKTTIIFAQKSSRGDLMKLGTLAVILSIALPLYGNTEGLSALNFPTCDKNDQSSCPAGELCTKSFLRGTSAYVCYKKILNQEGNRA